MARGDFLISCSKTDRDWARWVSGILEEQGYTTYIYIHNNKNSNLNKTKLKDHLKYFPNFIPIISDESVSSPYWRLEQSEIVNRMKQDPDYHFLPVYVSKCDDSGTTGTEECLCLFGVDEHIAENMLLSAVNVNHAAARRPFYPGANSAKQPHPSFPGIAFSETSLAVELEQNSSNAELEQNSSNAELEQKSNHAEDPLDHKIKLAGLAQTVSGLFLTLIALLTTGKIIPTVAVLIVVVLVILLIRQRKRLIRLANKARMLLVGYRTGLIIITAVISVIGLGIVIYNLNFTVRYYGDINEIYGLPEGIGSELTKQSRDNRVGYWKISDNALTRTIRLSYITGYQNIDLAAESISSFSLSFFHPSSLISYKYTIGDDKAKEVLSATHYRSDGKKLLDIAYSSRNDLTITYFDFNDTPQLFHSTIHRLINNAGKSLPYSMKQEYDSSGLVARRTLKALQSISIGSVYGEQYSYDDNYRLSELQYIGSDLNDNMSVIANEAGIATVKFEYSDNDMISVSYYADPDMNIAASGYNGAHKERIIYDGNHNIESIYFVDESGSNIYDNNGVHNYQYVQNSNNNMIVKETFFGIDGSPVYHKTDGCTSKEYDVTGKTFNIIYNDRQRLSLENLALSPQLPAKVNDNEIADMNPVPENIDTDNIDTDSPSASEAANTIDSLTSRYVTISHVLDNSGTVIKVVYLGTDGKSILNEYHYAERRYTYDKNKNIINETYYDSNGNITFCDKGYAAVEYQYNEIGAKIWEGYLDAQGELTVPGDYGYAAMKTAYYSTDSGDYYYIEESFYNRDNKPIVDHQGGYSYVMKLYDSQHRLIETYYLDQERNPVLHKERGYALCEYDYYGMNISREQYFDSSQKPVLRLDTGYAMWEAEYDERGNQTVRRYKGTDGELTLRLNHGFAIMEIEYDERGNQTACHYKGTDNELVLRTDLGCAIWEAEYDERGNQTEVRYKGTDGEPILRSDYGYAVWEAEYDERGNQTEANYKGTDGELILRSDYGYAVWEAEYDERGNQTKVRYEGTDGELILRSDYGYAVWEAEYDENGNQTEVRYEGTDGELILRTDTGYAIEESEFDERGNKTETLFKGTDGELIPCDLGGRI